MARFSRSLSLLLLLCLVFGGTGRRPRCRHHGMEKERPRAHRTLLASTSDSGTVKAGVAPTMNGASRRLDGPAQRLQYRRARPLAVWCGRGRSHGVWKGAGVLGSGEPGERREIALGRGHRRDCPRLLKCCSLSRRQCGARGRRNVYYLFSLHESSLLPLLKRVVPWWAACKARTEMTKVDCGLPARSLARSVLGMAGGRGIRLNSALLCLWRPCMQFLFDSTRAASDCSHMLLSASHHSSPRILRLVVACLVSLHLPAPASCEL